MFWKKKSEEGLIEGPPKIVPNVVQQYLIKERKVDPEYAPLFKSVWRKDGSSGNKIRIFDESDAAARKVIVKSYSDLNQHPELVIWEGSYDESAKKVELEEKNKLNWDTTIYTQKEVLKKIEGMTQPGSTIFFYQTRGGNCGGPLGKGANVIELNPAYPGKGQKKYNIYVTDVIDTQPVGKGAKLWNSDKPKAIADWVVQGHCKRLYS
jgi:hypothetical protein